MNSLIRCIPTQYRILLFSLRDSVLVSFSVPRYDQPPPLPPPVIYQPRNAERNQPVLVPANPYHTAEIPDWLQVYARAPLK